jgi:hypothetical protein
MLVLFYLVPNRPLVQKELVRIKSPDSVVEAVLIQGDGEATVSSPYKIFIVPSGEKPKAEDEVFRADHTRGLHISWAKNNLLKVEFDKARIFRFTKFWQSRKVRDFEYIVEIKIAPNLSSSL